MAFLHDLLKLNQICKKGYLLNVLTSIKGDIINFID